MDYSTHKKKKAMLRLKHRSEMGDEKARELLNASGFNRTPPEKDPGIKLMGGGHQMLGYDVENPEPGIPKGQLYKGMVDKNRTLQEKEAAPIKLSTSSDGGTDQNYAAKETKPPMQSPPRKRKIFARDPNYNFSPSTPAPTGPGTKQTQAAAGTPKRSLKDGYPTGGPGGKIEGVSGPMRDNLTSHYREGSSDGELGILSHREKLFKGQIAPSGIGSQEGLGKKSLEVYPPARGGRAGMEGGEKTTVIGHVGTEGHKKRKRRLGSRGMAFIGRQTPGRYSEGSAA